jgi:hypothetical protein
MFVEFMAEGSLPADEFSNRLQAEWIFLENVEVDHKTRVQAITRMRRPRSGICIAEYQSLEQLNGLLKSMPGAGIASIKTLAI